MSINTKTNNDRRNFIKGTAGALTAVIINRYIDTRAVFAQSTIKGKERLIVRSIRPEDLETPVSLLNTYITPTDVFYVRHHSYAPNIKDQNVNDWTLKISGEVENAITLTLDDIKKFPKTTVTVTLECAGNGRAFFDPPVAGIQWEKGAVGTARWSGVRIADVLKKSGIKSSSTYILLDGADKGISKMPDFQRNVPINKAMHPDSLIAYEMNGEPIPHLHGFPLRAIIPGWEGAYAVKWLNSITAIAQEHDGFFVKTAYRYPDKLPAPGAAVDPKNMLPLTGLVVKSFINSPLEGTVIKPGKVRVTGFAWAGDSKITKVDISSDGGSTWVQTKLGKEREPYTWVAFEGELNITQPGSYLIMSRAEDDKGKQQPVVPAWNPSGYLWNAIDKVRVNINEA